VAILRVKEGLVNDAKLTWNPDFWVEKNGKKILVAKAIDSDVTPENLDSRMKDAFAVMSVNYIYRDRIALSAPLGSSSSPTQSRPLFLTTAIFCMSTPSLNSNVGSLPRRISLHWGSTEMTKIDELPSSWMSHLEQS